MMQEIKSLCLQCPDCIAGGIPAEDHFTRHRPKPTPNFTAGVSEKDVEQIIGNPQQQGEERVTLDPIGQFTQYVERGCTPVRVEVDSFGGVILQLANGGRFYMGE